MDSNMDGDASEMPSTSNANSCKVECKHCGSLVLSRGAAHLVTNEKFDVPLVYQKSERRPDDVFEMESVSEWWSVSDMFTFDNVGFTHAHNGRKYLACADCELGPIGFVHVHDGTTRYLIARNRTAEK